MGDGRGSGKYSPSFSFLSQDRLPKEEVVMFTRISLRNTRELPVTFSYHGLLFALQLPHFP